MGDLHNYYKRYQSFFELSLLLLLAFVLKGWFLTEVSLNEDECFSLFYAQLPVTKIIAVLSRGNNPPLHEIILHYWINLAGITELSVRLPSLIFNCLTIVPLYLIGEKFLRRGTGLTASLVFIFSTFSLFMAQEARTYNLVVFLTACSFLTFLHLSRQSNSRYWVVLILLNALLCYAHYLAIWVIVVQGVAILSNMEMRNQILLPFAIHCAGISLFFAPFIPVLLHRFSDSGVHGTWISKVTGVEAFYNMLWSFSNAPVTTVVFISVMGIAILGALYKNKDNAISFNLLTVALWVWLPLIVSFLLSFKTGFFLDRYMFFTSPAYYLCVSLAAIHAGNLLLRRYHLLLPAMCVILAMATCSMHSKGQKYGGGKKDMLPLVAKINELNNDTTAIVICPDWFDKNVVYYLDRALFASYLGQYDKDVVFREPLAAKNIFLVRDKAEIKIPDRLNRLVYINNAADFHFPQNGILEMLQHNYRLQETYAFDGQMKMYVFAKI